MEAGSGLYLRGLGFIIGGAFFWLMYFDLKDHLRREPRRLLGLAYLLGCGSAGIGYLAYRLLEAAGIPILPGPGRLEMLVYFVALVGTVEEGAKFLVARSFIFRWRAFDEPVDGLVYAGAVAIGFASVENVLYLPHLSWLEQLARAAASPLTHSLFAAVWGFGFSAALFVARTPAERFGWQALTLLASIVLHGLYDFVLIAYHATFVASLLVLSLWLLLIRHARLLVHSRLGRTSTTG